MPNFSTISITPDGGTPREYQLAPTEGGAPGFQLLSDNFDSTGPSGLLRHTWEDGTLGAFWKLAADNPKGYSYAVALLDQGKRYTVPYAINGPLTSYPSSTGNGVGRISAEKTSGGTQFVYVTHEEKLVKLAITDITGGAFTAASEEWTWGSAPLNGVSATFTPDYMEYRMDDRPTWGDVDHASDEFIVLTTVNTPPADDVFTVATGANSTGIAPLEVSGVTAYAKSSDGMIRSADISAGILTAIWGSEFPVTTAWKIRWVFQYGATTYFGTTAGIRARAADGTFFWVIECLPDDRNFPNVDVDADGWLISGYVGGLLRYKNGVVDRSAFRNRYSEDLPAQGRVSCVRTVGEKTYFVLQDDVPATKTAWFGYYRKSNPNVGESSVKGIIPHIFNKITSTTLADVDIIALDANPDENHVYILSDNGRFLWFTYAEGDGSPFIDTAIKWATFTSAAPAVTQWPILMLPNGQEGIPYWLEIAAQLDVDSTRYLLAQYQLDQLLDGTGTFTKVDEHAMIEGTWHAGAGPVEGYGLKQFFLDDAGSHKTTSFNVFNLQTAWVSDSSTARPITEVPIHLFYVANPYQARMIEVDLDLTLSVVGETTDKDLFDELMDARGDKATISQDAYFIENETWFVEKVTPLFNVSQAGHDAEIAKRVRVLLRRLETQ